MKTIIDYINEIQKLYEEERTIESDSITSAYTVSKINIYKRIVGKLHLESYNLRLGGLYRYKKKKYILYKVDVLFPPMTYVAHLFNPDNGEKVRTQEFYKIKGL